MLFEGRGGEGRRGGGKKKKVESISARMFPTSFAVTPVKEVHDENVCKRRYKICRSSSPTFPSG